MERSDLAPYAARSQNSRGRQYDEPFKDDRPHFERDRDRIIHCAAFRRLEYKTQVFVNHEGDYYRTRLTHSLEVAQISRGIARRLKLNEDLAEALALAHDLGHTPFGHIGEDVLNTLMAGHGGFEHNSHSLRIVEKLEERYPGFDGLNLSYECREGIVKHSSDYDKALTPDLQRYRPEERGTLEAQIIDLADEIAYNNHDIDDGLKAGYIQLEDLSRLGLWQECWDRVGALHPGIEKKRRILQTISYLIGYLINDLVETTLKGIQQRQIRDLDQVRALPSNLIQLSNETCIKNRELKKFLHEKLYRHYKVERMRMKAERFLTQLFEAYSANPTLLPTEYQQRYANIGVERTICDYIAGMTDRYALDEYQRLFDPYTKA